MWKKLLLISILLSLCQITYGQKDCFCPDSVDYYEIIEKKDAVAQIRKLSQHPNYYCKALGYNYLAKYNLDEYKFDSVEYWLGKEKSILDAIGCVYHKYYPHYHSFSYYYYLKGDYEKMINVTYEGLNIARKQGSTSRIFACLSNLNIAFKKLKHPEQIAKYLPEAYRYASATKDDDKKMKYLKTTASTYLVLYQDLGKSEYLDTSKMIIQEVYVIASRLKDKYMLAQCFRVMEAFMYYTKKYDLAIKYLDSALINITPDYEGYPDICGIYSDMADISIQAKQYKQAKVYCDSSLVYVQKGVPLETKLNTYSVVIETAKYNKDFETAYSYLEKMKGIEDSLFNSEKFETIKEMEQKYEKAQNEQKIINLNKDNEINKLQIRTLIGFIGIAVLIIVVIIFMYRQTIIKNKYKAIETELMLNRARMNPHFFFNAIASLQGLTIDATLLSYLSKFARIMRQSLESTFNDMDTIENEIEFLENYLELQKLRYTSKLNYNIELSNTIEVNELLLPSMLLQPFVENSIEHGMRPEKPLSILILFKADNNRLFIEITDSGTGFTVKEKKSEHQSRATQIVRERLELLNKKYNSDAHFEILNENEGVKVMLYLPLIYKS